MSGCGPPPIRKPAHRNSLPGSAQSPNSQRAEALLGYGNWSKEGSKHIEDQLPLASRKEMRPVWRSRKDIEANLRKPQALEVIRRHAIPASRTKQAPSVAEVVTARHPRGPRCEIWRQHPTHTDTRTHIHAVADQQPPAPLAAIQTRPKYPL